MNSRKYAWDILYKVFYDHGFASLLMRHNELNAEDMKFVTNLVYGTIRQYRNLEIQWQPYVNRRVKPKIIVLLNMCAYELYYMSTPDYALVNEYVEICDQGQKGFVNAVVRKMIAHGKIESDDPCIAYSHPEWIYALWKSHYGQERALQLMKADQNAPVVYGRINPLKMNKETLMKDPSIHMVSDLSFISDVPIQNTDYFKNGEVLIQNPSSLEPVFALDAKPGEKVWDVCAAPGTKTQMIAACMENQGEIIATDLYGHRLQLIDDCMEKTGVDIVETYINDATVESFERESFDRILCDVPCSGLGDLSHKAEIRYHLKPEDLDEIIAVQRKILSVSALALKKGGVLVYSTCTLNKKENERQTAWFLKENPQFRLVDEKTIFPDENSRDGFYVAKLLQTME